jgi:hypothetical protein
VRCSTTATTVEEKIARVVAGRIQSRSRKERIGDATETLREIENLLRGRAG